MKSREKVNANNPIKLLSWNIAGLQAKLDDEDFIDFLSTMDIIMLQETWRVREVNLPGYVVHQQLATANTHGRASGGLLIAYKVTLQCCEVAVQTKIQNIMTLRLNWQKDKTIEKEWLLINVYMPPALKKLQNNYSQLNEILAEDALDRNHTFLLLAGDFNSKFSQKKYDDWINIEEEEEYNFPSALTWNTRTNRGGGHLLEMMATKGMRHLNSRWVGDNPPKATFQRAGTKSIIDYIIIFLEDWQNINKFEVVVRVESDHNALTTEVTLRRERIDSGRVQEFQRMEIRNTKSIKAYASIKESFMELKKREDLIQAVGKLNNELLDETSRLNQFNEINILIFEDCAKAIKGRKEPVRQTIWIDKDIRIAKKELKQLAVLSQKDLLNKVLQNKLAQEKKNYKALIKNKTEEARLKDWDDLLIAVLAKDTRRFWTYVARGTGASQKALESNILPEIWEDHFQKLFTGHESVEAQVEEGISFEDENLLENLEEIIRKIQPNKAAGPDGITANVLLADPNWWAKIMEQVIIVMMKSAKTPEKWLQGIIVPIFKKGNKAETTCYRPITLLDCSQKIYTKWILYHLQQWVDVEKLLPANQTGFRAGMSTIDNCYVLSHLWQKYVKRKNGTLYVAFLDLSQAFDMIDRRILWEILVKLGIHSGLLKLIQLVYINNTVQVRYGPRGELTNHIISNRGVRQGCSLAPLLFNIYVADIMNQLEKAKSFPPRIGKSGIGALLYADDTIVMDLTPIGLQRALDAAGEYFLSLKLKLNKPKSKIMCFGKKKSSRIKATYAWYIDGEELGKVKSYQYLGLDVDDRMNWGKHIQKLLVKVKTACGGLLRFYYYYGGHMIHKLLEAYDAKVANMILYGAGIWGGMVSQTNLRKIQTMENVFLRSALGLPRGSPTAAVYLETGRLEILDKIVQQRIIIHLRLIRREESTLSAMAVNEAKGSIGSELGKPFEGMSLLRNDMAQVGIDLEWALDKEVEFHVVKCAVKAAIADRAKIRNIDKIHKMSSLSTYVMIHEPREGMANYLKVMKTQVYRTLFTKARLNVLPIGIRGKRLDIDMGPTYCNCNIGGQEDVQHFILVCSHYKAPRKKWLKPLILTNNLCQLRPSLRFLLTGDNLDVNYAVAKYLAEALYIRNGIAI